MLTLILAATALASHEPADYRALAAVKPNIVAARVRTCGFRRVRVADDPDLQEDVVKVADAAASQGQLQCAARASLASASYVEFSTRVEARYYPIYYSLQRQRLHADAVAWLAKRGLLNRLPRLSANRSANPETLRAIEAVCGPQSSDFLQRPPFNTLKPATLPLPKDGDETFLCVMNSAEAIGLRIGFIGNELYRKEK